MSLWSSRGFMLYVDDTRALMEPFSQVYSVYEPEGMCSDVPQTCNVHNCLQLETAEGPLTIEWLKLVNSQSGIIHKLKY